MKVDEMMRATHDALSVRLHSALLGSRARGFQHLAQSAVEPPGQGLREDLSS